jgi:Flp pilus assembly pilin Flp
MDGTPTSTRRRREGGAAAVEFALVLPLLAIMVFGIIEFSLALRDHTVVTSNVRTAARVAATGAGAGAATCFVGANEPPCASASSPAFAQEAADAVQRSGTAMPADYIDFMLVYKANAQGFPGVEGNTTMPTSCAGTADCVMFTWNDSVNGFRYTGGTWISTTISACFPGTPTAPQHRVGVYLQAQHPFLTGLFGDGVTLSDRAVMDFEPLPSDICLAGKHL